MLYFTLERAAFPEFYIRFVEKDEWEKTKTVPDVDMTEQLKAHGVPKNLIGRIYDDLPNTYYFSLFDMSMDEFVTEIAKYDCIEFAEIAEQHQLDLEEEDADRDREYVAELGLDDENVPLFFFFYDRGDGDITVSFNTQKYFDENDGAMPDQHLGWYLKTYRNIPADEKLEEVCENMFSLEDTEFEGKKEELITWLESVGATYRPDQDFTDE
jgi:hypothetical protein